MDLTLTSPRELEQLVSAAVERAVIKHLPSNRVAGNAPKEWLSNREAREFLGLSKTTLQRYRTSGQLPYSKIGGAIFYRYEDVVAVLEANLIK